MKVAFYFDNSHLGEWCWTGFLQGHVAMSGTDNQFLHLLSRMEQQPDVESIGYFRAHLPEMAPANCQKVQEIQEAVFLAKERGADVLLLNNKNTLESVQALVDATKSVNLPVIFWDQNGPFPEVRNILTSTQTIRRIVCVSNSQADNVRHDQIFNKVEVIYNSLLPWSEELSAEESHNITDANNVCFLGATIPEKGFHIVVRSWPKIKSAIPSANLTIIGSSRLYDRRQKVGALGLGSREFEEKYVYPFFGDSLEEAKERGVKIQALMSPVEIRQLLKEQQVVIVNPCVAQGGSFETFCVSAIEAQAAGCVVVGGRRIGLRETVLDGVTGTLISSENQLAPAVIRLLNNPEAMRRMGQKGKEWVHRQFPTSKADAEWIRLFKEVLAEIPVTTIPFSIRRATPKDYARAMVRFYKQKLS